MRWRVMVVLGVTGVVLAAPVVPGPTIHRRQQRPVRIVLVDTIGPPLGAPLLSHHRR
jgi:hypothetical protein